jgi:hypothetical protein
VKNEFYINRNYDSTYSVCDSHNHSLKTFRVYKEATEYIYYLMKAESEETPIEKSAEEIKREERKTKLQKIFNFK